MKRFLAVLLAAMTMMFMAASAITTAVAAGEFSNDSTANLILSNATEGDEFNAYKLIDIDYDEATNTLSYSWSGKFKDCIKELANRNKELTVEEYMELGASGRKEILAQLHDHIVTHEEIQPVPGSPAAAVKTGDSYSAKWENLGMGGYFIEAIKTTDVYEMIFKAIEPEIVDDKYVLNETNFNISAKHSPMSISKSSNASNGSSQIGQTITYYIVADVPAYGLNALEKKFSITDVIPEGITVDIDSVKVSANTSQEATKSSENWVDMAPDTTYTLTSTKGEDGKVNEFLVSIENYINDENVAVNQFDEWYKYNLDEKGEYKYVKEYKKIMIKYDAILNENAVIAAVDDDGKVAGNTNTAILTYTPYPYVYESGELVKKKIDDDETVYTYGLKVLKYDSSNHEKMLSGAKFKLYSTGVTDTDENGKEELIDVEDVVTGIYYATEPDGEYTLVEEDTLMETVNGVLYIKGLDGDTEYFLKEEAAPSGYNLPAVSVIKLDTNTLNNSAELDATEKKTEFKEAAKKGYILAGIENNKGFTLPATGGVGVMFLKIAGIIAMAAAVAGVTVVLVRPKKKADK